MFVQLNLFSSTNPIEVVDDDDGIEEGVVVHDYVELIANREHNRHDHIINLLAKSAFVLFCDSILPFQLFFLTFLVSFLDKHLFQILGVSLTMLNN